MIEDEIEFCKSSIYTTVGLSNGEDVPSFATRQTIESLDTMRGTIETVARSYLKAITITMGPEERLKELKRLEKELPMIINIAEYHKCVDQTNKEMGG